MILFNDVAAQWEEIESTALPEIKEFLKTGPYIGGKEVERFEDDFKKYCGAQYAVGVSNGTDALKLAIQVLKDKKSLIFIQANAHISNALAPAHLDFLPRLRLIDCDENYNIDIDLLEKSIPINTNVIPLIIVTHSYGLPVNIPQIKNTIPNSVIIEDCSHAHGAMINGKHVGTMGDIGIFSLYPTKNLGAMGDAGIIITNNEKYYHKLIGLRNYGSYDKTDYVEMGWNARLDPLQALILRHKLPLLNKWNKKRRTIAEQYYEGLKYFEEITLPSCSNNHVYHLYPIRTLRRDSLKVHLETNKIQTMIHYPIPINRTTFFNYLPQNSPNTEQYASELLSLPMHPYLTYEDVIAVIESIGNFF